MKKLLTRTAIGLTAASMFAATLAPAAVLADTSCVIRNNGAFSHNRCRISKTNVQIVRQSNWAAILNVVVAVAATGGNDANNNTGGNVDVTSGDATVRVNITNEINQTNTAN